MASIAIELCRSRRQPLKFSLIFNFPPSCLFGRLPRGARPRPRRSAPGAGSLFPLAEEPSPPSRVAIASVIGVPPSSPFEFQLPHPDPSLRRSSRARRSLPQSRLCRRDEGGIAQRVTSGPSCSQVETQICRSCQFDAENRKIAGAGFTAPATGRTGAKARPQKYLYFASVQLPHTQG